MPATAISGFWNTSRAAGEQPQAWFGYHGEALAIALVGRDTTNPSGLTLAAYVSASPGDTPLLTLTPAASGPDGSGFYTITTSLTRDHTLSTLTGNRYSLDVWDTTNNRRLAGGTLILKPAVRGSS